MNCGRCAGMMLRDFFHDCADEQGIVSFEAWHCVNCGEVIDPHIVQNRLAMPRPKSGKARLKTFNRLTVRQGDRKLSTVG